MEVPIGISPEAQRGEPQQSEREQNFKQNCPKANHCFPTAVEGRPILSDIGQRQAGTVGS